MVLEDLAEEEVEDLEVALVEVEVLIEAVVIEAEDLEEAITVEVLIGAVVIEAVEEDFRIDLGKCTKLPVPTVRKNVKFLSNQHKESLFIVGNVFRTIRVIEFFGKLDKAVIDRKK